MCFHIAFNYFCLLVVLLSLLPLCGFLPLAHCRRHFPTTYTGSRSSHLGLTTFSSSSARSTLTFLPNAINRPFVFPLYSIQESTYLYALSPVRRFISTVTASITSPETSIFTAQRKKHERKSIILITSFGVYFHALPAGAIFSLKVFLARFEFGRLFLAIAQM